MCGGSVESFSAIINVTEVGRYVKPNVDKSGTGDNIGLFYPCIHR